MPNSQFENQNDSSAPLRVSGAITMYPATALNKSDRRFQLGDPGRYLAPGLFQKMLEAIEVAGINPEYGFSVDITDSDGKDHIITGIKSRISYQHHLDDGHRELGTFLSNTGYIAIAPMALCVDPGYCDECRWMVIEESFVAMAGIGSLLVTGEMTHASIGLPSNDLGAKMPLSPNKSQKAA